MKEKKTIGIIGGMGPLATADLFTRIINLTDAQKDAEHIHILIDNNPHIPDRTSAILHGTESPLPYLIESANRLKSAGADFLIIPCITSHGFYDELVKNGPVITYSHLEIAKYLGSAREVVSRMLKYFEKEGILTVSRKEIVITDKKRLFEYTK